MTLQPVLCVCVWRRDGRPCYILIGPEGDFTPGEAERLASAGVLPVGLGPHRLRTETAAIAALSAAVLLSDSNGAYGAGGM
jgi:16S rRNA (uracil1498-N3)-methyltransferase